MKAFAFCTDSHRGLLEDFLLPSLPDDLELIVHSGDQLCRNGRFMERGWLDCMRDKVEMVIGAIEGNYGECILHLDVDVQFFVRKLEPLLMPQLNGCDLVAQSDAKNNLGTLFCGGFFALRCCAETKDLFLYVLDLMNERKVHDQAALNEAIHKLKLRAELLPPDLFWSPRDDWNSGMPLPIPSSAVAHHANWCVGIAEKRLQLEEGKRLHQTWREMERHGSDSGKLPMHDSLDENSVDHSARGGEDIANLHDHGYRLVLQQDHDRTFAP